MVPDGEGVQELEGEGPLEEEGDGVYIGETRG